MKGFIRLLKLQQNDDLKYVLLGSYVNLGSVYNLKIAHGTLSI